MRRSFRLKLPAVMIAAGSFFLLGVLIVLVDPVILKPFYLAPFWPLVWIAFTWTVWLVTGSGRRGILYSSALVIFLILRYLRLGHPLNGVLLGGIVVAVDWYWSSYFQD